MEVVLRLEARALAQRILAEVAGFASLSDLDGIATTKGIEHKTNMIPILNEGAATAWAAVVKSYEADKARAEQLLDQAGLPLSGVNTFDTYADCTKNLPIVRFEQIK